MATVHNVVALLYLLRLASALHVVPGLSHISAEYDVVILDQFGVLHNGKTALPGAIECFDKLAASGKQLVVLSNASRRRAAAMEKLRSLGFDTAKLSGFITSGEEAWQHIASHRAGQRLLWFTWEEAFNGFTDSYISGLDVGLATASEADFVLCQGSQVVKDGQDSKPLELMRTGRICEEAEGALRACASRALPMLCANPDLYVDLPDGGRGYMPGLLAQRYEELGGMVQHFGKPFSSAFTSCLRAFGSEVDLSRVLHVGDSLMHDVVGANHAGVHSLFVAGGIHRDELMPDLDRETRSADVQPSQSALRALCASYEASPTHVVSSFAW